MKFITATFWVFILTFFCTSDSSISQLPTVEAKAIVTDGIVDEEMRLKELLSRIKLSHCDVLILSNNENLDMLQAEHRIFKSKLRKVYNERDSIQSKLLRINYLLNKNN